MKTGRLTTRLLGGRALRLQPDGRLVSLVRDGYETAFEEIFRRYGAALRSYAASIVTSQRADDVTQEAFTKAYLALRGSDKEIQLRPWLYRIVRNTALTNIRDEPKRAAELDEVRVAGMSPADLAEQREEIRNLMAGLRELPEPQRAAIVMRELEGLSHEQIASSLGLSGGAVRQSIYRARRALREGLGLLVPMPVLRLLLEEGFTQGASAAAAGGGAGLAVKTGIAALLAAGTITTGAVLNDELKSPPKADATPPKARAAAAARSGRSPTPLPAMDRSRRAMAPGTRVAAVTAAADPMTPPPGTGSRTAAREASTRAAGPAAPSPMTTAAPGPAVLAPGRIRAPADRGPADRDRAAPDPMGLDPAAPDRVSPAPTTA